MSTVWLIIRAVIMMLIISVLVLFAIQNQTQEAHVSFMQWQSPELPLFVLLWASFSLGVLVWFVASSFIFFNLKRTIMKTEKEKKLVQKELERLRNVDIEEGASTLPEDKSSETEPTQTDKNGDQ